MKVKMIFVVLAMLMLFATSAYAGTWCIEFREEFSGNTANVNVKNATQSEAQCIANLIKDDIKNAEVGGWEIYGWWCPEHVAVVTPEDYGCRGK